MADVLDNARQSIEQRLKELREETRRLEGALAAIAGGRRRPGRPRGSKARSSANGRRRGRRASGGTRSAQALKLVQSNPGITIGELAKRMKITPNYLYRVMPALQKEGKVSKRAKGWYPAGG
jgi:hypothetical protein